MLITHYVQRWSLFSLFANEMNHVSEHVAIFFVPAGDGFSLGQAPFSASGSANGDDEMKLHSLVGIIVYESFPSLRHARVHFRKRRI